MNSPDSYELIVAPAGAPDFLVHNEGDHVGVAVQDVAPGSRRAVYMDSDRSADVEVSESVPLGHKVALCDLEGGVEMIEYGVVVARTRGPILRGQMVHVHNVQSARWEQSK